jgi:hypothetical protein
VTTVTDAGVLRDRLSDLTGIRELTAGHARDAMHLRGWTRYQSLSDEQLGLLADDILSGWSFRDEVRS